MKKHFYLILALLFAQSTWAQEKLLYSTDFQDWTLLSASATVQTVNKTTDFSAESLVFKIFQVAVNPTGRDESRFKYGTVTAPEIQVTNGWAQAQKVAGSYIELSPLASITKVSWQHGATGSNRGYKLWKKNATDAAWVEIYNTAATPNSGQEVTVNINETNVALKFTNRDDAQNAYMFNLKIYGSYVSSNPQYPVTTSVNIEGAGTIAKTPNSELYDQGGSVSLQANPAFGYKFLKWVNSQDAELSTVNPYVITVNSEQNIKAVFEVINTYSFEVVKVGSNWGEVLLSPQPTNGRYVEGTEVTVKVVPNAVTNFSYWEDNSTVLERTITVNSNKSLTATFDEIPFIVGWNFKDQTVKQSKTADYHAESTNTGTVSAYEPTGTPVNWLSNLAAFSPAYPNVRFWTPGTEFLTKRRYLKAQFATTGYKNIQIKSLVSANYQAYSVQTLQYSLDDVNYIELARVDITDVYNSGWKTLDALLPLEAQGKEKIYIRWIADTNSPVINPGTENDGTAFTNIFVFAEKEVIADTEIPVLVSSVPVNASATASINGSIILTFNEKVKAGNGSITLNSTAVTGIFGSKTAAFPYERLNYNTEYTLTIPAGALTDMSGNVFPGIVLTFKTANRTEPTKKLFDAVVAKDGSGDYISVIDAIAAAPVGRAAPWLIFIKNGKYTGHHDIPANKPFIHLIGQSRDHVIISDDRLSGDDGKGTAVYHVSQGATMVVNSSDCYFENIIFENSHGYEKQLGPQALALYTLSNHFAMNNCYLRSYQDTYLTSYNNTSDRHYIKDTKIEGAVDFIYGGGDVFFDNCTITVTRKEGGYIVAPSHKTGTVWGYVFSNCTVDEDKATGVTTYLGRPWQNEPKTVFLNTKLKVKIYPVGWHYEMGAIPAVFADYGTMDANGNPVDLSQRIANYEYDVKDANGTVTSVVKGTAKKSLTDAEAATYTYENVIMRSGDSWDPRMISEAPAKPTNVVAAGTKLSWDNVAYSRLYIILRNDLVVGFSDKNQFTDATAVNGTVYNYGVQAVSEYGALSAISAATAAVQQAQTITFESIPAKTFGTQDFEVNAISSSGLPVTLTSSDLSVATIVNNKIHIVGAGTTSITASQPGNTEWLAADNVSRELVVEKQSQTITFNAIPSKSMGSADFDAGATASSGLAVSLSSSNSAVAEIINGKVHILGVGSTIVTASQPGNAQWLPATNVSQELVVGKQSQTITFAEISTKTIASPDFEAGAVASSGLAVTYLSSNLSVATVANGMIQITGLGTADITATQAGNASFSSATLTRRLTVVDKFKLPSNNFRVSVADETCSSVNNGKIVITAIEELSYKATVLVNGTNQVYPFNKILQIPSLPAGAYNVCITVDGQGDYNQCFDVAVKEPQPLSVYAAVNSSDKTVRLNLAGSSSYAVELNGRVIKTNDESITLNLAEGLNKISVSTGKECQGVIERTVFVADGQKIYPNPFDQTVFVNMGNDVSATANISVHNLAGSKLYGALHQIQNGVAEINLMQLPVGTYIIKVKTGLSESSSKILKK